MSENKKDNNMRDDNIIRNIIDLNEDNERRTKIKEETRIDKVSRIVEEIIQLLPTTDEIDEKENENKVFFADPERTEIVATDLDKLAVIVEFVEQLYGVSLEEIP